jgi:hypothetical protein
MKCITNRAIWTAVLSTIFLYVSGSPTAAQLPPQEESVGDGNNNEDSITNAPQQEGTTCSLCLDGSNPIGSDSPFKNIFGLSNSLTCSGLMSMASSLMETSETCERMQLAAFQGGCCAQSSFFNDPASFDRCRLCPRGEGAGFLPFKEIPLIAGSTTIDATVATCSDLRQNTGVIIDLLQGYVKDPGVCQDSVQRRTAGWCGCMGSAVECNLACEGGASVNMSALHPLTGVSCREIDYQIALLDAAECTDKSLFLQFDPTRLCCPSSNNFTTTSCSLCTSRQGLTPFKTIQTDTYGTVTCADVQAATDLVVSDQICTDLRQQFSVECCLESPDDQSIATCALICPSTGELPADLLLQDPETGYSCNHLVAEYAKYTASECNNAMDILGFDAVAFCCPGGAGEKDEELEGEIEADETALSENEANSSYECSVCPKDKQLLYPSRILFTYNERTCSDIEETASLITTETACWDLLDTSRALSNCACRLVQIDEETGPGEEGSGENGNSNGSSDGSEQVHQWVVVFAVVLSLVV